MRIVCTSGLSRHFGSTSAHYGKRSDLRAATMDEIKEAAKCYWFHHPDPKKRCKKNDKCTFFHSVDRPTRYEEVQRRRLRNDTLAKQHPIAVKNFGEGILRDRTTAIRAWFRKECDAPDGVQVQCTEIEPIAGNHFVVIRFVGMEKASALSHEVVLRSNSVAHAKVFVDVGQNDRLHVTSSGEKALEFVFHGTDLQGFKGIVREKRMLASASPLGVYCGRSIESVIKSGYNCGFIIQARPLSMIASKGTTKLLSEPLPGIALKLNRCADSEYCFHTDSLEVVAAWAPLDYLGALVREALHVDYNAKNIVATSHRYQSRAQEQDAASDLKLNTPSAHYRLHVAQVDAVLQYLTEDVPPCKKPVLAAQASPSDLELPAHRSEASSSGLRLTAPPRQESPDLDDLSSLSSMSKSSS